MPTHDEVAKFIKRNITIHPRFETTESSQFASKLIPLFQAIENYTSSYSENDAKALYEEYERLKKEITKP